MGTMSVKLESGNLAAFSDSLHLQQAVVQWTWDIRFAAPRLSPIAMAAAAPAGNVKGSKCRNAGVCCDHSEKLNPKVTSPGGTSSGLPTLAMAACPRMSSGDVGSSIHSGLNSASFDIHATASGTSQRWLASIICRESPFLVRVSPS